ncbi:MAG: MBL fold metallo-hydrolase [Dehalococcoidia bacterium]|nr:MBL fold metallo-hydrolase [Dehalococcoidia bacterium]
MILETLPLGDYQANCYLYASTKTRSGFVIDPGGEASVILSRIKELCLSIEAIILTHGHPDHTDALLQVKAGSNAPVWAHEDAVSDLNNRQLYAMLGFCYNSINPDRLLRDGDVLGNGDEKLKVLHTPGHTLGCICLLGGGVVFTGDTLFNGSIGRTDMPGGNPYTIMDNIHSKLMTLTDETVVYPGHGPSSTIGEERLINPFLR